MEATRPGPSSALSSEPPLRVESEAASACADSATDTKRPNRMHGKAENAMENPPRRRSWRGKTQEWDSGGGDGWLGTTVGPLVYICPVGEGESQCSDSKAPPSEVAMESPRNLSSRRGARE
ncbi:hypothetical protein CCHR01_12285 [Colletotrichum chrysophilum]|uniref:Uncharacterized protein n=1 Tax=Colletotrichum chrysophilum TaxID=1836956 RepID=A0AAD9ABI6_9PEZI|nr:hypothetical protein CCHR01_12285 [Colletotrichum chrysophilum]